MPPLTVMVKPASGLCNMRCTYCFYADVAAHRGVASYGIMGMETLEKLMRRAFAYGEGQLTFAFQGGEPTLAGKSFFRQVLALQRKYNARNIPVANAIQTNGYALDEEWMDIFHKGKFLVGVSLDGTAEIHNRCRKDAAGKQTYGTIVKNIEMLRQRGIDYNILCVVNQVIATKGKAVFRALQEHRYLQFIPCLDDLDGTKTSLSLDSLTYGQFLIDTFDLYEEAWHQGRPISIRTFDNWIGMLKGRPPESCAMAGRCGNYYVVESDGSVYPCDFYVLDHWKMGNINDSSFFSLAKSPVSKAFREASWPVPPACNQCTFFALCRNGCKRDREPEGTLTRLCAGHQLFFLQREKRLQQLAKRGQRSF